VASASEGAGLGHDFLAHVERTRLLVHVLDLAPELTLGEEADAVENHETIEQELAAHDQRLAALPRILALSKADLIDEGARERAAEQWRERLGPEVPVIVTSSATGLGLAELSAALFAAVPARAEPRAEDDADAPRIVQPGEEELLEHMVFRPAASGGFTVQELGPGSFAVRGRGIEMLLARHDVENEDAMTYLEGRLRRIGVLRALEEAGFEPGDEIEIGGVTFELDPAEEEPRRAQRPK
jgi:GTP-binding protein